MTLKLDELLKIEVEVLVMEKIADFGRILNFNLKEF